MVQKTTPPPSQEALIRALALRGDPMSAAASSTINILYKTVVTLLEVLDEHATTVEDLCALLASIKPALDEHDVVCKMLLTKYPEEPLLKDLLEQNQQLTERVAKEAARLILVAFKNTKKGKG